MLLPGGVSIREAAESLNVAAFTDRSRDPHLPGRRALIA